MGKSEAGVGSEATNGCPDVTRPKTGTDYAVGSRAGRETGAFYAGIVVIHSFFSGSLLPVEQRMISSNALFMFFFQAFYHSR